MYTYSCKHMYTYMPMYMFKHDIHMYIDIYIYVSK